MPIEGFTFRLNARGRPAGRLILRTGERGHTALVEARMQLQGVLGHTTWTQTSRCHPQRHHSLRWFEASEGGGDARSFEVRFDADSGLVTATRGRQDQATAPYLRPYRDPLSLLRELRAVTAAAAAGSATPVAPWRVPLLGKDVTIARTDDVELEVMGERRRARAYTLYPGGSVVVVDLAPPHAILRLVQRLPDALLEATLVDVAEESTMSGWDEPQEPAAKRTGGRRRSRRKRRGRGRG
ncbi:MAG: hypothetical protein K0A98_08785 [Trueperaceae bacterium]|nr:hypothetical protein [Trueperaceae bacterium]